NGYQDASRSGVNAAGAYCDVGTHDQIELLKTLLRFTTRFRIEAAGDSEHYKQEQSEAHTGNRRDLLLEQVRHSNEEKCQSRCEQSDRDFTLPHIDIEGSFVFLVVALESQYKHTERLHEETPDDPERISLT